MVFSKKRIEHLTKRETALFFMEDERIEWIRGKVIGTGRFGCVYSGLCVET